MLSNNGKKVVARTGAMLLAFGAMFVTFQNCGKAGFENQDVASDAVTTESIDPKLSSLPFPYDASINQLAFMSCEFGSSANNSDVYFSWKVGAYDNPVDVPTNYLGIRPAGLSLRQDFKDEFNRVGQIYNASFRPTKIKEALTSLPMVAGSRLQLSLRDQQYPQTSPMKMPTIMGSSSGGADSPAASIFAPMSSDSVVTTFQKQFDAAISPINYLPLGPTSKERSLETSLILPFGGYDPNTGLNYHDMLMAKYQASILSIGFASGAAIAGPAGNPSRAYAMGLRPTMTSSYLTFTNGKGFGNTTSKALVGISEFDMRTGVAGSSWACSSGADAWSFKIVRWADRNNLIYKKDNFTLASGVCPGKNTAQIDPLLPQNNLQAAQFCPSPENPAFGLPLSYFPGATAGSYVCPANRRSLVPGQATAGSFAVSGLACAEKYAVACPPEPFFPPDRATTEPQYWNDGLAGHPDRLALLGALRRFLPESDWDINISRKCIVEKRGNNACYIGTAPPIYDEYFFATTPTPGRDVVDTSGNYPRYGGCGNGGGQCAAYMTLCVRK